MICNVCGKETPLYKAVDGRAINGVILENSPYVYCVRCLRRDLLQRLSMKLHPVVRNSVSSKEMIEFAERALRESKDFEALV